MYIKIKLFRPVLLLIILLMSFSILSITSSARDESVPIIIYHTNDIHGRAKSIYNSKKELVQIGFDILKDIKKREPSALLIDAGDATQGNLFACQNKGSSIIELMNIAGYDMMTIGNHEFDYGQECLINNIKQANFPVISANIIKNGEALTKNINGTNGCNLIRDINGKKVGFFGITASETAYITKPENVVDIEFKNEIEISKQQVEKLKQQGAEIIIGIMHVGIDGNGKVTSHEIAEQVDGIDLIIDGHSHSIDNTTIYKPNGKRTVIAQTGNNSQNLGRIQLDFNSENLNITAKILSASEVGRSFIPDNNTSRIYNRYAEDLEREMSKVIGKTALSLYGGNYCGKSIARLGETNIGSLASDSMIWKTKKILANTEYMNTPIVALQSGGSIRDTIKSGYIKLSDVNNVFPFNNAVVIKQITPKILFGVLENNISKLMPPKEKGCGVVGICSGFPHIGGMRMEFDISKPVGSRIRKLMLLNDDGTDSVELDRGDDSMKLILATDDFKAEGGDGYALLRQGKFVATDDTTDVVLAQYITELSQKSGGEFLYTEKDRVHLIKNDILYSKYSASIKVSLFDELLISKDVIAEIDGKVKIETRTNQFGEVKIQNLCSGGHIIKISYNGMSGDCLVNECMGIKRGAVLIKDVSETDVCDAMNLIDQIDGKNENIISLARYAYDSLSDLQKVHVKNYNKLVQAEILCLYKRAL